MLNTYNDASKGKYFLYILMEHVNGVFFGMLFNDFFKMKFLTLTTKKGYKWYKWFFYGKNGPMLPCFGNKL
jgi:hypothetical protein